MGVKQKLLTQAGQDHSPAPPPLAAGDRGRLSLGLSQRQGFLGNSLLGISGGNTVIQKHWVIPVRASWSPWNWI